MNKHGIACGLAFAAAVGHSSAFALVGGSVDDNLVSSPWAGVGAITIDGNIYSGVLIDSQHVLTAAHVVAGQEFDNVSFSLNVGGDLTNTYTASAISVYGGYSGTAAGADGVWHDDLAIITLSTSVAGEVPWYDLYGGSLANQTLTLVGYGAGGDGVSGVTSGADASVKRVGQNNVDVLLVDDDGGMSKEVFIFDFDGPTKSSNLYGPDSPGNLTLGATIEAQFASGDSGSPVFVDDNGVWKIAGIANFNTGVTYGSVGGGTIVAPYQTWIQATIAPVPEPHAWLMMLAGVGLVGAARFNRQRV